MFHVIREMGQACVSREGSNTKFDFGKVIICLVEDSRFRNLQHGVLVSIAAHNFQCQLYHSFLCEEEPLLSALGH